MNLLITGSTGKLGRAIVESGLLQGVVYAPKRSEMDISDLESVKKYLKGKKIDFVIHCAALTDMAECESNPEKAEKINAIGTKNLAEESARINNNLRFIYISTDYVYPSIDGNYSEDDNIKPFNVYAQSKLEGENFVREIKNHCIIRTSFFNPKDIKFDTAPDDSFSSKIPLIEVVEAINILLHSKFIGVLNVGQNRKSMYELYKKYVSNMKPIKLEEINKNARMKRAKDSSMNVNLWKRIRKENESQN